MAIKKSFDILLRKLISMGSGGSGTFRCKYCRAHSGDKVCIDCKKKGLS